jgi:hypothetical protein
LPLLGLFLTVLTVSAQQQTLIVSPVTFTATLQPGDSATETIKMDLGSGGPFPFYEYWGMLKVKASSDYEGWVTNVVPSEYSGVYRPGVDEEGFNHPRVGWPYEFDVTIRVPAGTLPGVYMFVLLPDIRDDQGDPIDPELWMMGQIVEITVPIKQVIPEVPYGTITTILTMFAAMGYALLVRK